MLEKERPIIALLDVDAERDARILPLCGWCMDAQTLQLRWVSLEEAGTRPEESVFIDDREENIIAAEKLGLQTVLLNPDTNLRHELQKIGIGLLS